MSEVLKAIAERSSTRGYTPEPLTPAELDALLRAGLQAPTATNRQELHFTVADTGSDIVRELELEMTGGKEPERHFHYGAPTLILISGETDFRWTEVDAGIAVENIALAAESLGLGSVIIGCIKAAMLGRKRDYFAKVFCFPDGYDFMIAIAVGHKAAEKEPHTFDKEKQVTVLYTKT